jgi:non-specific serine/threonine protein kinase
VAELIDHPIDTGTTSFQVPAPRTALVGRDRELAALLARLREPLTPIVTITGPGGVGKTRLALHAAWALRAEIQGDVVFVSLADVDNQEWLVRRVARAMALRSFDTQISEATLLDELRERTMLLVLDNLEQIEAAGQLLARIADSAPGVKLLITSRIAMHIRGEVEIPLAPLAVPRSDRFHPPNIEELKQSSAVMLLRERAQAVNPSFEITPENAADIVRICERLDGLPLALELAAARLKLLTPAALLARLDNRLRILGGGARDLPDRQQNLRQTIAWSYDLLDPNERSVFRALSVFAGGFSLDAAAAVLGADEDDPDLLDLLGSLVDQSLVRRMDAPENETRLGMLETIREFGLEQLRAYGEEAEVRAAHAEYYRRYAETKVSVVEKILSVAIADQLEHELANIHQALDWFIERSEADGAVSLVLAMAKFWLQRGYLVEGSRLMERAVEFVDRVAPITQARMLRFSAWFLCMRGDFEEALIRATRALEMARGEDDPAFLIDSLNNYGVVRIYRGELEDARAVWQEALEIAEKQNARRYGLLNNLGVVARLEGDLDLAEAYFIASRDTLSPDEQEASKSHELANLAELAMARGDLVKARQLINEWVELNPSLRDLETVLGGAWCAAKLTNLEGDPERAARIIGWTDEIRRRLGISDVIRERFDEELQNDLINRLGPEAMDRLGLEGAQMSNDELARLILTSDGPPPGDPVSAVRPVPLRAAPAQTTNSPLTARELEVARLVAEGKSNREIAEQLFISARTAQTHVTNILTKLSLESRAALAAYVVRQDLG